MSTTVRKIVKPTKGVIPAGFADGGKFKPFAAKDTKGEEMAEAKAVRSGKVSPKGYAKAEKAEEQKEGGKFSPKKTFATGKALASGKLSAKSYAATAKKGR